MAVRQMNCFHKNEEWFLVTNLLNIGIFLGKGDYAAVRTYFSSVWVVLFNVYNIYKHFYIFRGGFLHLKHWKYHRKSYNISILYLLWLKVIVKYWKLVSIDFLMYGNIFFQFMANRWNTHIFPTHGFFLFVVVLSWRKSLSYKNQSIDLLFKSMDWFLYNRDLCNERNKVIIIIIIIIIIIHLCFHDFILRCLFIMVFNTCRRQNWIELMFLLKVLPPTLIDWIFTPYSDLPQS